MSSSEIPDFSEAMKFWPDYLREQELQEQKPPSEQDCEDFEWEIEPGGELVHHIRTSLGDCYNKLRGLRAEDFI